MFRKILHSVDILNREYCSGWCFHRIFRNKPVQLSFYIDENLIGEVTCSDFREDLKEQNLHPSGLCGFQCPFDTAITVDSGKLLKVFANHGKRTVFEAPIDEIIDVYRPKKKSLFFMHIPKSAGTSFNNYAKKYFGFNKTLTHIESLSPKEQSSLTESYDYLAGHITLQHIPKVLGGFEKLDLHSIVRNPLNQVHSHLAWIKGIALDQSSDFYQAHHDVVRKMGKDLNTNNVFDTQSLQLFVDNLDGFQIDFFDNIQTRYFLDYRPDRVAQRDLDNAVSNLKLFSTIGMMEYLDDYLKCFCQYYNMPYEPISSIHNLSKVSPVFDINNPMNQKIVKPLIQYDQKLYDAIKMRLSAKPKISF